jgi:hypothetical protein
MPVHGTELGSATTLVASDHPPHRLSIFFLFLPLEIVVIYILTHTRTHIYKGFGKLVSLHP